jgi:hypothetical protein
VTNLTSKDPLFDSTKAYLESVQTFLEQEKQSFELKKQSFEQENLSFLQAIKAKFLKPENNNSQYEKMIADANTKTIEKMNEAIRYIGSLRTDLAESANKAEETAWKNLPKE